MQLPEEGHARQKKKFRALRLGNACYTPGMRRRHGWNSGRKQSRGVGPREALVRTSHFISNDVVGHQGVLSGVVTPSDKGFKRSLGRRLSEATGEGRSKEMSQEDIVAFQVRYDGDMSQRGSAGHGGMWAVQNAVQRGAGSIRFGNEGWWKVKDDLKAFCQSAHLVLATIL